MCSYSNSEEEDSHVTSALGCSKKGKSCYNYRVYGYKGKLLGLRNFSFLKLFIFFFVCRDSTAPTSSVDIQL